MRDTKNVLILADNQPVTRLGAISLWNKTIPEGEVFVAKNKEDLIRLLSQYPQAIIMIDYTLFDLPGFDSLFIISLRFPNTRWIFFSNELSEKFLRRIVIERRFSVVMKDVAIEEIVQVFQQAVMHKSYICEQVRNLLKSSAGKEDNEKLTSTEREILKLIAQGKTSQMIADERKLSIHTISTHRKNIFRKIGVNNVLEASKYAAKAGVINVADYYI